jgi:hypothetical protein
MSTAGRLPMTKEKATPQQKLPVPLIGKIKIGEKKGENRPGKAIDYFRATGQFEELFNKTYGDKPNKLTIIFPSTEPEICCAQIEEGRDNSGKLCAIYDGATYRLYDKDISTYKQVTEEEYNKAKERGILVNFGYGLRKRTETVKIPHYKTRLALRFVLLELKGVMGAWELSTMANASSIPGIIEVFDNLVQMAGPAFTKIPFDLTVKFHTSNKPGDTTKFPVLSLLPNMGFENTLKLKDFVNAGEEFNHILNDSILDEQSTLQLTSSEHKQLQESNNTKQLPESNNETKTDEKEFSVEKLVAYFAKKSSEYPGAPDKDKLEEAKRSLNVMCSNDTVKVIKVLDFLTGKTSTSDLNKGEVEIILEFIPLVQDGDIWLPARAEAPLQFQLLIDHIYANTVS